MRAAVSEAICIDSLLPVLRHLLGIEEVQKSGQESNASYLAMKEVNIISLLSSCLHSASTVHAHIFYAPLND